MRIFKLVLLAAIITIFVRTFVFEGIYIASDSMLPTLQVDDHFFVDKITYKFRSPKKGEIVVLKSPVTEEKDLVKRIIAVGGDVVTIDNKDVYVNDKKLIESYVRHSRPDEILKGDKIADLKVPENDFFVLGDNRDESNDSRDWIDKKTERHIYFVHRNYIKGKIIRF
ncbi:MAG: signal peptidase I [Elusimicrobia bacterium RIFOXYD2_FULL_34_15]|nr:MAG: signal peptidase I [Elusimicrobia bacterium RIFOXYD2_FULL_34_15]